MSEDTSDPIQKSIELMQASFEAFKTAEAELALGHFAAFAALTLDAQALRAAAFKLAFPDDETGAPRA